MTQSIDLLDTSESPSSDLLALILSDLAPRELLSSGELGGQPAQNALNDNRAAQHWDKALRQPLEDFLSRPSKGIRRTMAEIGFELAGGAGKVPTLIGEMLESLHAGSLIIDDIQDRSVERRGRPALHLIHGEPLAINAGNWLYFWPLTKLHQLGLTAEAEVLLTRAYSNAVLNCHYGQALDLGVKVSALAQHDVSRVVGITMALKSGSLVELGAVGGAIIAGADRDTCRAIGRFAQDLGTALQMLDDLSGIQSLARCQKGHEDLLLGKLSWVWAYLAETLDQVSFARLQKRQREVMQADLHPEALARILRKVLGQAPRRRIEAQLNRAQSTLGEALPGTDLTKVEAAVAYLLSSFT